MPENNPQNVFFVDDDLIERLMRGDTADVSSKKKSPAESSALVKAIKLAEEGKLDEAVIELEGAAARGENPKETYFGLGHLHFEQQHWDAAAGCYAKAAEADPAYLPAHYDCGLALERLGKFEEAEKSFATAVGLDPNRWQAQTGRGMCLLNLGNPQEALACFDRALAQSPNQDRSLLGKSVALHQLGKLEEASEIYRKLLPSNANSTELLGNMIAVAVARKDDAS